MHEETITIDIDGLRNDMREECLGAYFGGGFGVALIESFDVDRASSEELVEMAQNQGIDLDNISMKKRKCKKKRVNKRKTKIIMGGKKCIYQSV